MLTTPYGALPDDTGEFLLGKVVVTPVFLESSGAIQSHDWTPEQITETKQKIQDAMSWWVTTLDNVTDVHSLEFVYDFTYADAPVATSYEPIDGSSDSYALWVNEFLDQVGHNTPQSVHDDVRSFNNTQRIANDADWGFTIIVADSDEGSGQFAAGKFRKAFAFAGGNFIVTPSTRPTSTFAHELGHMFWARDEYENTGNKWLLRRGYYNTQNTNAADNPAGQQQPSIMADGSLFNIAYNANITSTASMEMLGWRDSDGDGVFDVLDVPHQLEANGFYNPATDQFRLTGQAIVGTLPNQNPSGNQSDITTNEVDALEYRIDGSPTWLTAATYHTAVADLDVTVDMNGGSTIEFRTTTYDPLTAALVTSSNVFSGGVNGANTTALPGISGFVYHDANQNEQRDQGEIGVSNVVVRLTDVDANPLPQEGVEPDDFGDGDDISNATPGVQLTAEGFSLVQSTVLARERDASTGTRVFAYFLSQNTVAAEWIAESRELVATFSQPTTRVSIDAISNSDGDVGRLEAFNITGDLIGRYTTAPLANGEIETMEVVAGGAQIAWVVIAGFADTAIRLDNLQYGAEVTAVTDANGGYLLQGIPNGVHYVQSDAGSPLPSDLQEVTMAGQPIQEINFASQDHNPWHNFNNPRDATGDSSVTLLDLREVFVDFTLNGFRELNESNGAQTRFVDINNDGSLTLTDLRELFTFFVGGEGEGEPEEEQRVIADAALIPLSTPTPAISLPSLVDDFTERESLVSLSPWSAVDDFWASAFGDRDGALDWEAEWGSEPLHRAFSQQHSNHTSQPKRPLQEKNPAKLGTNPRDRASKDGADYWVTFFFELPHSLEWTEGGNQEGTEEVNESEIEMELDQSSQPTPKDSPEIPEQ